MHNIILMEEALSIIRYQEYLDGNECEGYKNNTISKTWDMLAWLSYKNNNSVLN